jgi:hypothetical protein
MIFSLEFYPLKLQIACQSDVTEKTRSNRARLSVSRNIYRVEKIQKIVVVRRKSTPGGRSTGPDIR